MAHYKGFLAVYPSFDSSTRFSYRACIVRYILVAYNRRVTGWQQDAYVNLVNTKNRSTRSSLILLNDLFKGSCYKRYNATTQF